MRSFIWPIALSATLTGGVVTAVVQVAFRKSPKLIVVNSLGIALATFIVTLLVSPVFLIFARRGKPIASLTIAAVGLLLISPTFAVVQEIRTADPLTVSAIGNAVLVSPVFAAFSTPVALPFAMLLAWAWYRKIRQLDAHAADSNGPQN